jgi:predicted alpha/beta-fold hydrolase
MEDIARMADFDPPAWLRNPHVQSILPSLPLRRPAVERDARTLLAASSEQVIECGEGVRLLATIATQEALGRDRARKVVVLLHGWEGSADSQYLIALGQAAFGAGFDVIRLNLRDHGSTHHLNRELFHSCRIAEVMGAVASVQETCPDQELSLAGFSLGGNFVLRVGARARAAGLKLRRIVAVCPVLDPAVTLQALETGPALYREYFLLKWRRSLRKKQEAWPGVYDFTDLVREKSLTGMTACMVPDLATYLRGYAITGEALASLETESCIITSMDDPIIPPHELRELKRLPALGLMVARFGGHCGFVDGLSGPTWIDRAVLAELLRD